MNYQDNLNKMIHVEVDGVTITGQILVSASRDICVAIRKPFQGFHKSVHRGAFNPNPYTPENIAGTAEILLKELYDDCLAIVAKLPSLQKTFPALQAEIKKIEETYPSRQDFLAERRRLRSLLRAGQIDQKEYQQPLGILSKQVDQGKYHVFNLLHDYASREIGNTEHSKQIFRLLSTEQSIYSPEE